MNCISLADHPVAPPALKAVAHGDSRSRLLIYRLSLSLIFSLAFSLRGSNRGAGSLSSRFVGALRGSDDASFPIGDDH